MFLIARIGIQGNEIGGWTRNTNETLCSVLWLNFRILHYYQ